MKLGTEKGEVCNRDGCEGVINWNEDTDWGCSCHISPPCSHCVTDWHDCSECGWEAKDEQ